MISAISEPLLSGATGPLSAWRHRALCQKEALCQKTVDEKRQIV
jgi:hypothetical protein